MLLSPLLSLFLLAGGDAGRLAVMPLAPRSVKAGEAEIVTDILAGQLTSQAGVRVMERSEMNRILHEQGFQKSGACDGRRCAVEVGRILGIDQMVVGAFGRLGKSWILVARRVSVETGEIVAQSTRQYEGPLEKAPDFLVAPVVADLAGTGWTPPVEVPTGSLPNPTPSGSSWIDPYPQARVPIRIRHASDSAQSWVYLEDGSTRRFLGKTPLDTSEILRHNVFIVAAEPKEGGASVRNWLIGPSDSGDVGWRNVEHEQASSPSGTENSDGLHSELGTWKTYGEDAQEPSAAPLGKGIRTVGLWTMVLGGGVAVGAFTNLSEKDADAITETDRDVAGSLMLLGAGTMAVGGAVALLGQIMVGATGNVPGGSTVIRPLAGLGASGRAGGLAFATRF